MIKRFSQSLPLILFALIISVPIILPYFHSGYFPSHDGEWAVVRMGDMFRSLRDHQFPVRWSGYLNFQYGYPLFNFAYPIPYYFGTIFHFIHFGFIASVKSIFALSVLISAIGMFMLSRYFWKSNVAGSISTILYVYLPYRLIDLYVRGSIGESVSLALFPFLIYFILKLAEKQRMIFSIFGGVLFALLIGSHNIMTVLFTPIMICVMIERALKNKKVALQYILLLGVGVGLSAFFWIPALAEKHLIVLSQIPIANRNLYFVHVKQLIYMPWGYGTPTDQDPFPYEIGIPQVIGFIVVLSSLSFSIWRKMKSGFEQKRQTLFYSILIFMMLLMLLSVTAKIWEALPLLKEINYPWTLLAPIGFFVSFICGGLMKGRYTKTIGGILAIAAICLYLPFAHPRYYTYHQDNYYLTNQATTTSSSELMPLTVKKLPVAQPDQRVEVVKGSAVISDIISTSKQFRFRSVASSHSQIQINTIYYPGWRIFVDGHLAPITYSNPYGVMNIYLPTGSHTVMGRFTETPVRLASDIVSFLTIISIFFSVIFLYIKNRYATN